MPTKREREKSLPKIASPESTQPRHMEKESEKYIPGCQSTLLHGDLTPHKHAPTGKHHLINLITMPSSSGGERRG